MLTIDHGESAPSHILPALYDPVSARPQKSIRFSCCAAIPPPAALCVSIERIYSLFFNGLILYTIKSNLCQRCFGTWILICQNTAFRSYFQAHCRHGKIFTMNCRPFSGQEAIMLSKKLYRSDMINWHRAAPPAAGWIPRRFLEVCGLIMRIRRPVLCRTKIPVRDVPRRVRRRVCALIRYRFGSW